MANEAEMAEVPESKESAERTENELTGPGGEDISPDKDGGVLKLIKREGTGEETPGLGSEVFVHYTGTLLNGEKFDSSRDRGDLFKFKLGEGEVIKAWDIGVATMKKGEVCMLTCAAKYAYGEQGSPPKIPANATLVFEVELFEWKDQKITDDGGVTKGTLLKGEGYSKPNEDASVSIHLRGTHEGKVFEERDVSFLLGEGSENGVVEGVEKALYKMLLREKAMVKIKSEYGFGKQGNSELGIPPNADIAYEVYLSSFDKAKETYEMDLDEKLETSDRIKEKGTKYFKAGEYGKALHQYERMIKVLDVFNDEEKEKCNPKKCIAHLNAAMCNLKVLNFFNAREQCDKALKIESKNVKGLFRRGQAQLGMSEFESAKQDFLEVLSIEPNNKAAKDQLNIVKAKIKQLHEKDKQIYGNMFERFARVDEKKEQNRKKAASDLKEDTVLKDAESEAIKKEAEIEAANQTTVNGVKEPKQEGEEKMETTDETPATADS